MRVETRGRPDRKTKKYFVVGPGGEGREEEGKGEGGRREGGGMGLKEGCFDFCPLAQR